MNKSKSRFLEDKSVMDKIMKKVQKHGEKYFGMTDVKIPEIIKESLTD